MSSESSVRPKASVLVWIGRVISLLTVLMMLMSAYFKLSKNPMAVEGFAKMGYPAHTLVPIGIAEVVSAIIYLIPQTAVLGAILLTGYLGGAVDVHVRADDQGWPTAVILGVMVWAGLFLRDPRVRALLPIRKL